MLAQDAPPPPDWLQWIVDRFAEYPTAAPILAPLFVVAVWLLMLFGVRRVLLWVARRIVDRTKTEWDDLLLKSRLLHRLSHVLPFVVVLTVVEALPGIDGELATWIRRVAGAGIVVALIASLHALLDGVHAFYRHRQDARRRPIKGYVQLVKILATVGGVVVVVATLSGSEVGTLVTGIGVSTAVVLFVFKDTILSVLASIHLTAYDMVRVGDWIEMPKHGADGDVVDIALHTVKVQNWDKTITTIPTHDLYAESFRNWRGMQESGGRRIKRSLTIDVGSIRFLEDEDLERLREIRVLRDYLDSKQRELAEANADLDLDAPHADRRSLTNIGTFRVYCVEYLRAHPGVNQDMTLLVRQLQSTESGVPLELYLFTKTKNWAEYERVQADVFDHLFAVAREFDLRIFQLPTGRDFEPLVIASRSGT
ncbi:MAG: mechanosensitive ion channel [Planctomycetes bacterium]|nr:mechanosensitive ion channel [Planctomycetota bacterium]